MRALTDDQVELLHAAATDSAVLAGAEAFRPEDAEDDWTFGTFELAASIRQNLPAGLGADDFDGDNIEAL